MSDARHVSGRSRQTPSCSARSVMLLRSAQGLLNGDAANTAIALTTRVALGLGARVLKDLGNKGEIEERDPASREVDADAVDQSGILRMFVELDQNLARFHMPTLFTALAGGPTCFRERDILGQIGGPMVGAMEDTHNASRAACRASSRKPTSTSCGASPPRRTCPVLASCSTTWRTRAACPNSWGAGSPRWGRPGGLLGPADRQLGSRHRPTLGERPIVELALAAELPPDDQRLALVVDRHGLGALPQ